MKIVKIMVGLAIFLSVLSFQTAKAQAPVRTLAQYSPSELVVYYAKEYKVSAKMMSDIVSCESGWDLTAHKLTQKENSWGLVQINLKAHINITKAEAVDPIFSLQYLAQNISTGNSSMWTCTRIMGYNKPISEHA